HKCWVIRRTCTTPIGTLACRQARLATPEALPSRLCYSPPVGTNFFLWLMETVDIVSAQVLKTTGAQLKRCVSNVSPLLKPLDRQENEVCTLTIRCGACVGAQPRANM